MKRITRINRLSLQAIILSVSAFALPAILTAPVHAQTFFSGSVAAGTKTAATNNFLAAAPNTTLFTFEGNAFNGGSSIGPNAYNSGVGTNVSPALLPLSIVVTGGDPDERGPAGLDSSFGSFTTNGTDSIALGNTTSGANGLTTARINLGTTGQTFNGFASEIAKEGDASSTLNISLFLGDQQVGTTFSSGTTRNFFFGATSVLPFDNVRIAQTTNVFGVQVIDNVRTQLIVPVVVPEAGSLALILPALGAVFCVAKSRGTVIARRRCAA